MSFIRDLTAYIADNTYLTMDTSIFVGDFISSSPSESVAVTFVGRGNESESGIVSREVYILARSKSYPAARTLAYIVFDLLKAPEGFSLDDSIYTTETANMPYLQRRDGSLFVFAMSLIFNRKQWEIS